MVILEIQGVQEPAISQIGFIDWLVDSSSSHSFIFTLAFLASERVMGNSGHPSSFPDCGFGV
jgi:hypothetical protein